MRIYYSKDKFVIPCIFLKPFLHCKQQNIIIVCMRNALILIGASLFLTACENVKSTLGMDHYQADEFNIKQNDPLEVPPNYKLMPPRTKDKDGKSIPLNSSAEKAKQVVGGGESEAVLSEASQHDLKDKTGSADSSIRDQIDKESEEGDSSLDKKLSAWKKEFVKNAKSINPDKAATNEHHESLEEKVESDIKQKAVEQDAEKGIVYADKTEELREHR